MKIAIYGSRRQDEYISQLALFFDTLAAEGVEVVMHRKLFDSLRPEIGAHLGAVKQVVTGTDFSADVALSLGGDGTFLRTAMWVGSKCIPILGINTGHLGYLSAASIDELPQVARELVRSDFSVVPRSLIQVVEPELVSTWPYALNEIAVTKEENASMISADTSLDDAPLAQYLADGLIVSTPTGSTAYNLSVGGPIIQPEAPVWVISPIAAHSLGMRPLVISDDSTLTITVDGRAKGFRLSLDGRSVTLPIGDTVELRKAPFAVVLISRKGHSFTHALREKLHWNE